MNRTYHYQFEAMQESNTYVFMRVSRSCPEHLPKYAHLRMSSTSRERIVRSRSWTASSRDVFSRRQVSQEERHEQTCAGIVGALRAGESGGADRDHGILG